jgi:putative glutamine amidotransferase
MPSSRLPIVAVTATTEVIRGISRVRVNQAYTDALLGAGLVPLVVPPTEQHGVAERVLELVDGLVLTGGEDIAPDRYGAAAHPTVVDVQPQRDAIELALAQAARDRGIPTLAICRGVQLVNVALGGTLVQDIPSLLPSAMAHDRSDARFERVHEVRLSPSSRLARALGVDVLRTNSSHHQSIDRVAPGICVTGRTNDGVVEGIEYDDDRWWMLGVQWHPEELIETPEPWDRALFAAFASRLKGSDERG